MVEDVEPFVDEFVREAGGDRFMPDGAPAGVKSADYFFSGVRVACELKCLEENFIANAREKVLRALTEAGIDLERDGAPSELSDDVKRRIKNLLERPVRRILDKANGQLKSTRELLGAPRVKTVLWLCNDAVPDIRCEYIVELVSEILVRDYSGIDGLVCFSVNYPAAGPGGLPIYQWLTSCNESSVGRLGPFLSDLRERWMAYIQSRLDLNFVGQVGVPEHVPVGLPAARNPRQAFAYRGPGAANVQTPPSLIATPNLLEGGARLMPQIHGECLFHPVLRTPEEGLRARRFGWMHVAYEPGGGADWLRELLASQDEDTRRFDSAAVIEYGEARCPDGSGVDRTWIVRTIRYHTAAYTDITAACQWTPTTACVLVLLHPGPEDGVLREEVQYFASSIHLLTNDSIDPENAHEHWRAMADKVLPRPPRLV